MTSIELAFGQDENAHEHGALPGEAHLGVVILRPENDVGDVAQPHERSVLLGGRPGS